MNEEQKSGDDIRVTISGDVSGQVAVGKGITQTQTVGAARPEATEAELAEADSSTTPAEELTRLQSLLEKQKHTLYRLLEQKATYAQGEEPIRLLNQIDAAEEEIRRLQERIRQIAG